MSRYSGKCDLFDVLEIHNYTDEELKNNIDIYLGYNGTPLKIETRIDLIPYYPHIVISAVFDNTKRKATINLSSESFVDSEERELLYYYLKQILKVYNRCKRNKVEFDAIETAKEVTWHNWNIEAMVELANRVKEHGKKATTNDIHLKMHEYYRKELVNEMIENNLNPADYGYERFMKRSDENE